MNNLLILLYDGDCGLCNRAVQFVLKRDRRAKFTFTPLQSPLGEKLLAQYKIKQKKNIQDTFVLIDRGRAYTHSAAALQVCRYLGNLWPLVYYVFNIVPVPLRDGVYRYIAANRHRFFPQPLQCQLPDPSVRQRFIDSENEIEP